MGRTMNMKKMKKIVGISLAALALVSLFSLSALAYVSQQWTAIYPGANYYTSWTGSYAYGRSKGNCVSGNSGSSFIDIFLGVTNYQGYQGELRSARIFLNDGEVRTSAYVDTVYHASYQTRGNGGNDFTYGKIATEYQN